MRIHTHSAPRRAALVVLPVAFLLAGGCQLRDITARDAATPAAPTSAAQHGNGVDRLNAKQILDRAGQASKNARSVRIRGNVRDGGEVVGLDVRIAGKNTAAGTITMQGQQMKLIRIGSAAYIHGNAEFWKAAGGQEAADMFAGKYLKTNANDEDFKDFTSLTTMSAIVSELLEPEAGLTKGGRAQVNGQAAIALADGTGGKLYVATEGRPYMLRLSPGAGSERLDFLAYNRKFTIKPPPGDRVIDAG